MTPSTVPDPTSRRHPLFRLSEFFGGMRAPLIACVMGLMAAAALNLVGPWLIAQAIDVEMASKDWDGLVWRGLAYLSVLVATLAVTYTSRVGIESIAQRAMRRLKQALFGKLLSQDLSFHDNNPSGRLITRVQGDTESLRVLFTEVILSLPADIALMIGMFVVMVVSSPRLALYVSAVVPFYAVILLRFRRSAAPRFLKVRKASAELTGFWAEHTRAMPILQMMGRQRWVQDRATTIFERVYRSEVDAHLLPVYFFNGVFLVRTLGMAAVLCLGALDVLEDRMTLGQLVMGLGYLRLMFNPLMRLSFQLTTIESSRAAGWRIESILDASPSIADPEEPVAWPGLKDAYALEHVAFEYDEGTPVLRDISLSIAAGSHVGVVGPTGSGKSTLINLLLRFRDPTSGRVTVDGVDLRDVPLEDIRGRIGLVLQDVHLFAGTLLDNLGGDPDRATAACSVVGLDLPLDTAVRDGGSNLSRGQRQLATFARALVYDPDVLVLDEATSAVDPGTEARIRDSLEAIQRGRTTITVAHRLATVRECDQIFVLVRGEIAERGTHAELMALAGYYAALHVLQHGPEPSTTPEVVP